MVCDRAHNTLQYLSMAGEYQETPSGYGLPANIDTAGPDGDSGAWGHGLTLLNAKNEVVAQLGNDVERISGKDGGQIRGKPDLWIDGSSSTRTTRASTRTAHLQSLTGWRPAACRSSSGLSE
ncbi:MAG: hypothetical protein U0992_10060 [Planctomycetaceae bacterium]